MKESIAMTTDQIQEQQKEESQEPMSPEARERGAIVLEVLAGILTPTEAAEQLSINPPSYYSLEQKALQGLVRACESRPKGPGVNYRKQIRELEDVNRKLEREARRYQSLTRAAQKAIGLIEIIEEPRSTTKSAAGTKTKKRSPKKVRAQRAADRLRGKTTRKKTTVKTTQSLQKAGTK